MPAPSLPSDDAVTRATDLKLRVAAATQPLLVTAASITDEQALAASRLPGWTRGHVLTHLARNADGLRNLLIWARTGKVTPMYPSSEARDRDIAAGASRPARELLSDLRAASAEFAAEAGLLAAADWTAQVGGMRRPPHQAWYILWRRLQEVEIHHADLDAGYDQRDWPAEFAAEALPLVAADLTRPDSPAVALVRTDSGGTVRIGPPDRPPSAEVHGADRDLLAWLTGRSPGLGLTAEPPGPLPPLPAW